MNSLRVIALGFFLASIAGANAVLANPFEETQLRQPITCNGVIATTGSGETLKAQVKADPQTNTLTVWYFTKEKPQTQYGEVFNITESFLCFQSIPSKRNGIFARSMARSPWLR